MNAETAHLVRGENRHLGNFLGARVRRHVCIADEERAARQYEPDECRVRVDAFGLSDDLVDALEVLGKPPDAAAEHCIGLAPMHHQRRDRGRLGANDRLRLLG